jgi:hypothetical protein
MPIEELPFNLQDLNLNSHTPRKSKVGRNEVVQRFVDRVEEGFRSLQIHPGYLDLPAYDALRKLGSTYTAWSTIDIKDQILVLCPFSQEFFPRWEFIASQLRRILSDKNLRKATIERMIDRGTTQLIVQSLYEQIRRSAGCVVDLSNYNPSVFFELGVRLATSEYGAVQIVEQKQAPGGESAPSWTHIEKLFRLFAPIVYKYKPVEYKLVPSPDLVRAVQELLNRNPGSDKDPGYNRIHRVLLPVIGTVQEAHPSVIESLKLQADALHHGQQGQEGRPQVLFHASPFIKQDAEETALETRIAAWLYIDRRIGLKRTMSDNKLIETYVKLGEESSNKLYDLGDPDSVEFAEYIED